MPVTQHQHQQLNSVVIIIIIIIIILIYSHMIEISQPENHNPQTRLARPCSLKNRQTSTVVTFSWTETCMFNYTLGHRIMITLQPLRRMRLNKARMRGWILRTGGGEAVWCRICLAHHMQILSLCMIMNQTLSYTSVISKPKTNKPKPRNSNLNPRVCPFAFQPDGFFASLRK